MPLLITLENDGKYLFRKIWLSDHERNILDSLREKKKKKKKKKKFNPNDADANIQIFKMAVKDINPHPPKKTIIIQQQKPNSMKF